MRKKKNREFSDTEVLVARLFCVEGFILGQFF